MINCTNLILALWIVLTEYAIFHVKQGVDPVEHNTRIIVVQMSESVFVGRSCSVTVREHDPVILCQQSSLHVHDGNVFFSLFRSEIELVFMKDRRTWFVAALGSSAELLSA